jgi:predicted transcriptional regulator
MTVTLPPELEKAIERRAADRQVSVEVVVREAIEWYLRLDAALMDELAAWQETRDEAFELIEAEL